MKIEIRRWDTNEIIVVGEYESIKKCLEQNNSKSFYCADLRDADLRDANLRGVDLRDANLRSADLRDANLRDANLRGADLWGADLWGADLRGAKMERFGMLPDLYLLKMQNCKLKAWKYLINGKSPYQHKEYKVGKTYKFPEINRDELTTSGAGGNVATLMWCLRYNLTADEFIEVGFESKDIVMPIATDGKFRVGKFKILRQINRKQAIKLLEGK